MQRSIVGVPERTRCMWRVYLFDHGMLHPIGPPHETEIEADHYACLREQRQPGMTFVIRRALVLLN